MVKLCSEDETVIVGKDITSKYPFTLSSFQTHAINAILQGDHALITAHTGSGKTLPAEFAIEHFARKNKKVIYTAPIKALSNQKYHEFSQKYPDISFGIVTGDIKFNPEADVIIMTTEILRNQLFRAALSGSTENTPKLLAFEMDIENDLACVVFDEVHYINDKERGKIWEETILNLPAHVQMVMLSATIDSPDHFARWVESRGDGKTVHLITTYHRVVPLYHHGYITLHDSYSKNIKDAAIKRLIADCTAVPRQLVTGKKFDQHLFYKMQRVNEYIRKTGISIKRTFVLNSLVHYLRSNDLLPAITFIFSRSQVERAAREIQFSLHDDDSQMPATVDAECRRILRKLPNHEEYMRLPEYTILVGLLQKGIAIHHAGMLPVFREMVEMLFEKNYIKLLFATETFSVGINMPTKTVVFTSLKKFDGTQMRSLHPHEYTQMAGRAGRRGIDTKGHVIHCNNLFDDIGAEEYQHILCGSPQRLTSKFHVTYNLVLNMVINGMGSQKEQLEFINGSLLKTEIDIYRKGAEDTIRSMKEHEESEKGKLSDLRTPLEVCEEYISLKSGTHPNKLRKRNARRASEMEEEHRFLIQDVEMVRQVGMLGDDIDREKRSLDDAESYIARQTSAVLDVLREQGFVHCQDGRYVALNKAVIAALVHEAPGHVLADVMQRHNSFNDHDSRFIAAFLSCFTDVRDTTETHDTKLRGCEILDTLMEACARYQDYENEKGLDVIDRCEPHTAIFGEVVEWCNAADSHECQRIVRHLHENKGILLGDFIKAILRINSIANELIKVAEHDNNVALVSKLCEIRHMTLKHVVTNQSMYI